MPKINNPHDKYLKATLSKKENAIGFLQNYLPKEIVETIDLSKVKIEKDSYITEELQEYFTDLLYKVNIKGKEGYIYALFEHKSYPDKLIGLQLLEYLLQCWKSKIKQKEKLPVVIPLLIYHGEQEWKISREFKEILEIQSDLFLKYIPNFEYLLYDLSKCNDSKMKGPKQLKIMMQLMKYINNTDFLEKFKEIMKKMEKNIDIDDLNYMKTITIYILSTTEIDVKEFVKVVKENVSEKGGEIIMTTAEKLMNEGRERGIQQGIQQGIEQGKYKEKVDIAKLSLKKGLDVETIAIITGLSVDELKKIK